jgi:hypothetical protein
LRFFSTRDKRYGNNKKDAAKTDLFFMLLILRIFIYDILKASPSSFFDPLYSIKVVTAFLIFLPKSDPG